jgi:hypothetical protein
MSTPRSGVSIVEQVRELWARPEVQRYVDALARLDVGTSPVQSFVGFNVTRSELLTAKVNHHHFRRLDDAQLDRLVPVRQVFDRYYPRWEPTEQRSRQHTGSAFVIKVGPRIDATYQFHFRFAFGPADFADLGVAPHELDLTDYSLLPGISFEYAGPDVLRKLYYYLERPHEKQAIARDFGEPWAEEAQMLEYTQTDRARKVIFWNFDAEATRTYVRSLNWPTLDSLVDFMDDLGCTPMFPGVYEGGEVRAIYFFRFADASDRDPWSRDENRQIYTLPIVRGSERGPRI